MKTIINLTIIISVILAACFAAGCSSSSSSNNNGINQGPFETDQTVEEDILDNPLIREVSQGLLEGIETQEETWAWLGVPYAKPPVGALRWKAPSEPETWEGVKEADDFCNYCTQFAGLLGFIMEPALYGTPIGSEDCLYLNIWRPSTDEENLPVFFWIHGGANLTGMGPMDGTCDGAKLASRTNMIIVNLNYRLGPMGWLSHPLLRDGDQLDNSGNFGTLDIIRALEWVRENISSFGGSPDNVTIAGESAGGHNVLSLLASPLAAGLFHRAISESGYIGTTTVSQGEQKAQKAIDALLAQDGYDDTSQTPEAFVSELGYDHVADYLRQKPVEDVFACFTPGPGGIIMDATGDLFEDGTVIPDSMSKLFLSGEYNKVPAILGCNSEELKMFLPLFISKVDETGLCNLIKQLDTDNINISLDTVLSPLWWPIYEPIAKAGTFLFQNIGVDLPGRLMAMHQEDVFLFEFAWDNEPEPLDFLIGAGHGIELPFVFGNFLQDNQIFSFAWCQANKADRETLSANIMTYWSQFAKTGNPNSSGLPQWLPLTNGFSPAQRIILDQDIHMQNAYPTFNETDDNILEIAQDIFNTIFNQ